MKAYLLDIMPCSWYDDNIFLHLTRRRERERAEGDGMNAKQRRAWHLKKALKLRLRKPFQLEHPCIGQIVADKEGRLYGVCENGRWVPWETTDGIQLNLL